MNGSGCAPARIIMMAWTVRPVKNSRLPHSAKRWPPNARTATTPRYTTSRKPRAMLLRVVVENRNSARPALISRMSKSGSLRLAARNIRTKMPG